MKHLHQIVYYSVSMEWMEEWSVVLNSTEYFIKLALSYWVENKAKIPLDLHISGLKINTINIIKSSENRNGLT